MIKNAVNTYGPEMTKTEVRLGDVGVSLLSAEAELKDFLLGNPESKKILIKNFIVRDGKVNLAMAVLGENPLSANLPDIHLKNVGQKKGGASPAEAFKEIFAALYIKIRSPAVTDVFNKGLKKLTTDTRAVTQETKKQLEDAGQSAKDEVKATTDKLKGIFGK